MVLKERRQHWDDVVQNVCMVHKDSIYAWVNADGFYNSLATIHRVHDISPTLPHVEAGSTCSHYAFSQGRLTWHLFEKL